MEDMLKKYPKVLIEICADYLTRQDIDAMRRDLSDWSALVRHDTTVDDNELGDYIDEALLSDDEVIESVYHDIRTTAAKLFNQALKEVDDKNEARARLMLRSTAEAGYKKGHHIMITYNIFEDDVLVFTASTIRSIKRHKDKGDKVLHPS